MNWKQDAIAVLILIVWILILEGIFQLGKQHERERYQEQMRQQWISK